MKQILDRLIFQFLNNINTMVGTKITEIRESKSISLEEVAEKSDLTLDQLKNIENNNTIPSLAPLIKIARVLKVRVGAFMGGHEHTGPIVTLKDEVSIASSFSATHEDSRSTMNYISLAGRKSERHMEPFIIEIEPSGEGHKTSTHEGEEFIYVISGTVEVEYGNEKFELAEGDSIYYDSLVAHQIHASGGKAKIIATVYVPA